MSITIERKLLDRGDHVTSNTYAYRFGEVIDVCRSTNEVKVLWDGWPKGVWYPTYMVDNASEF